MPRPVEAPAVPAPQTSSKTGPEAGLEALIGYHLRRASMADLKGTATVLAEANLRPVPFSVLCVIAEGPGVTSAEVCRMLSLQRANIVPILAALEERVLVRRAPDPADHRVQRLFLTDTGRACVETWLARIRAHEEALLRRLTAAERRALRGMLERVWKEDDGEGGN